MISPQDILVLHSSKVENWHKEILLTHENLPLKFIEENHYFNFLLWHEEDIARVRDIESLRIVTAKRNIDRYNQARNNAMEKIDEWILNYLHRNETDLKAEMHSETPGMIIDRLSIMSLKRFHMNEEAHRADVSLQHIASCTEKTALLDEQIDDLSECLTILLSKIEAGEIRFKVYRQLKMYNDPSLNPQLYKRSSATS
jgi:hypothetical protein